MKTEDIDYYLQMLTTLGTPSQSEEKELFRKVNQNSENAREEVIIRYYADVLEISQEISTYIKNCPIEDIMQEGYIGLINAINKYSAGNSDLRFKTIARREIRNSIIKAIKQNIRLVNSITDTDFKREVAGFLSEEEKQYLESIKNIEVVSLDNLTSFDNMDERTIVSQRSQESAILDRIEDEELIERIKTSMSVTERQRSIILRYLELMNTTSDPLKTIATERNLKPEFVETQFYVGAEHLLYELLRDRQIEQSNKEKNNNTKAKTKTDKIRITTASYETLFFGNIELSQIRKRIVELEERIKKLISYPNIDPDAKTTGYNKLITELEDLRKREVILMEKVDKLKSKREQETKVREERIRNSRKRNTKIETVTSTNKPKRFLRYLSEPDQQLCDQLEIAEKEEVILESKFKESQKALEAATEARVSAGYDVPSMEEQIATASNKEALIRLKEKQSEIRRLRRAIEISKLPREAKRLIDIQDEIKTLKELKRKTGYYLEQQVQYATQIEELKYEKALLERKLAQAQMYGYVKDIMKMPER